MNDPRVIGKPGSFDVVDPDCAQLPESCLVAFVQTFLDLDDREEGLVRRLEDNQEDHGAGVNLFGAGDELDQLLVMRKGWAFSSRYLPEGKRQVLQIHVPGDLVALPDIVFETATSELDTLTECTVCPFPRSHIDDLFRSAPRLGAFLYSLAMVERAILLDRATALGRFDAPARVAHFLLEIYSRLLITHPDLGGDFELPLTQDLIGDATGLSSVHVSRTMGWLESEGLIERPTRRRVVLREIEALKSMCQFVDRWHSLDLGHLVSG